jgi:DNA-binding transcriptional LysR family regulator
MKEPRVSLEQWHIFRCVVEYGSFQAAADALLKSQSSVSYAVQKLQQRLGVPLFTHRGRRAVLTDAGQLMLQRAKDLLQQAATLEQAASDFVEGWEPQVNLVVNMVFPQKVLIKPFEEFGKRCPNTRLEVFSESLSGVDDKLTHREVDLAVCGLVPVGFIGEPLCEFTMLRVAHGEHPLLTLGRTIHEADMRQYRQIVVRDSGSHRRIDAGWLGAEQRWTVSHFYQSLDLLKQGLGYATMPKHMIERELASGELKPLPMQGLEAVPLKSNIVFADKRSAGRATFLLAQLIKEAASRLN